MKNDHSNLKSRLSKFSNCKLIGFKIPALTEQMNKISFIDPVHQLKILNQYQNSKLIFIYRDVRDVITSMKNYILDNGTSWLDYCILGINNDQKITEFDFIKKNNVDLDLIDKSTFQSLVSASIYWIKKNEPFFEYIQSSRNILGIKYEDLCTNPKNTIEKIINFLDLPWEDNLLKHHGMIHDEVSDNGITVGHIDSTKNIYTNSIGRYKNSLSSAEEQEIISITKPLMKQLGYKV